MSLLGQVCGSTRARVVFGVIGVWLAFQGWQMAMAPGKISPDLGGSSEKVNVRVELPFAPERFHVQLFQQYGRVSGADDRSIDLRGVRRSELTTIARPYWVTRVEKMKEEG